MDKQKNRKVTIQNVADAAGVSYVTAARALSGTSKYSIKVSTQDRVIEAARQLGYRPNPFARSLATQRSRLIGLCGNINIAKPPSSSTLSYFFRIDPRMVGILRNPRATEYNVMIIPRDAKQDPQMESHLQQKIEYLDGLIYISPLIQQRELLIRLSQRMPLVIENAPDFAGIDSVSVDQRRAIADSLFLLARRGATRIALFTTGNSDYYFNRVRIDSFRKTLQMLSLPFQKNQIGLCETFGSDMSVYRVMSRLLKLKPRIDAVIVPRDHALIASLDAIRDAGLTPGRNIKLISLIETELSRNLKPGVTTVAFPVTVHSQQYLRMPPRI